MNYFEKKQWIRLGICAVVVLAITLLVSGLIGDNLKYNLKEETKAPELPEATGENQFKISKMVYFNGTDDSMGGGEITVLVTVGEGKTVEALEIDASSQTENMGQKTMKESFIGQFVGKAGPFVIGENIDAVSGATRTSEKVVEALNEALEQSAGGESETKAESEGNPESENEPESDGTQESTEAPELNSQEPDATQETTEAPEQDSQEPDATQIPELDTVSGTITKTETVYFDEAGTMSGDITVTVGFDENHAVSKLEIDASKQTPGFGQKAMEESFINQFIGKTAPFVYGENGIDAISGATRTSETVIRILNDAADTTGKNEGATVEAVETETGEKNLEPWVQDGEQIKQELENAGYEVERTYVTEDPEQYSAEVTESGASVVIVPEEIVQALSDGELTEPTGTPVPVMTQEPIQEPTPEPTATPVPETTEEPDNGWATWGSAGTTEEPETTEPPKQEEPAGDSRIIYGSYTAKKETNFSVIRVYINTKGGKITDCRITSEAKSEGSDYLTDEIKDAWAKAIVENGTAETDVITGATLSLSSAAVVEAVNDILAQAGAGEMVNKPESVEETTTATTEPEKEDAEKKDEPQRESTGKQVTEVAVDPSRVLYGSYTTKRETDFSVIRVTVNTKGGQITDCRITSEAKSEGSDYLTDEIKDAWAKAIVENGTADTDAITGATLSFSSAAVVEAVNEILAQIH